MIDLIRSRKPISDSTMPDLYEFMTTSETVETLGFTEVSVRNMVYKKKLASIRFGKFH